MAELLDDTDWQEEDAAWERLRQDALTALRMSDLPLARRHIGQALALAKAHFQTGDPRLAATLACQTWLLQDSNPKLASTLFQEALAHWGQATAWLLARPERLERKARSSTFHLRLESKHPGGYRERLREDMGPLLTLGRALTEGLRDASHPAFATGHDQARSGSAPASDTHQKVWAAVELVSACRG